MKFLLDNTQAQRANNIYRDEVHILRNGHVVPPKREEAVHSPSRVPARAQGNEAPAPGQSTHDRRTLPVPSAADPAAPTQQAIVRAVFADARDHLVSALPAGVGRMRRYRRGRESGGNAWSGMGSAVPEDVPQPRKVRRRNRSGIDDVRALRTFSHFTSRRQSARVAHGVEALSARLV
ncbi:hypothetical protein VTO73DRAFT_9777 [Trametes versicolor]